MRGKEEKGDEASLFGDQDLGQWGGEGGKGAEGLDEIK